MNKSEEIARLKRHIATLEEQLAHLQQVETKQHQAEDIAQSATYALQTILNSVYDAVFIHAVDGTILDVNEQMLKLYKVSRDQVLDLSIAADYSSPDNPIEQLPVLWAKVIAGEDQFFEWKARRPDGSTFDVEVYLRRLKLGSETVILANVRDISARKQVEQTLRESEERYRLIAENSSDLIGILDHTGRYTYASPSHLNLLGYPPEGLIGASALDFIHPDELLLIREEWRQLLTHGRIEVAFRYRHIDNSWHWLETVCTLIKHQNTHSIIIAGRDVTDRKRIEAQLLQIQKMDSVGRLAGGIAHDFNNLLMAIAGYTELALVTLPPNTAAYNDLRELQKTTQRATTLTRQLLAFAREQIIAPCLLNLNDLVLDMGKLLRHLIGENIELSIVPSTESVVIIADPSQIEQVVINLAINARDAMPNGGKLTIETDIVVLDEEYVRQHVDVKAGIYVLLAISDNGIGMTSEVKQHLFEPFFTTKAPDKGTGLGLATCYGIVTQHGGNIWIYSEEGQGTTVKVYLPRIVEATPAMLNLNDDEQILQGQETVLLVEDEPEVRMLIARMLQSYGYRVIVANNGSEALQIERQHANETIDVLLTDIVMPQIGGQELTEQMQQLRPEIKVLFMSGYTDNSIIHHQWLTSEVAFLQKPFTPEALARKLREIIGE